MADRNRSDLDREQRGSSNPSETPREDRSTRSPEGEMGGTTPSGTERQSDKGVGSESENRGQSNVGSTREGSDRTTGSIEGDENLNRR